jgi:hypothetical protein
VAPAPAEPAPATEVQVRPGRARPTAPSPSVARQAPRQPALWQAHATRHHACTGYARLVCKVCPRGYVQVPWQVSTEWASRVLALHATRGMSLALTASRPPQALFPFLAHTMRLRCHDSCISEGSRPPPCRPDAGRCAAQQRASSQHANSKYRKAAASSLSSFPLLALNTCSHAQPHAPMHMCPCRAAPLRTADPRGSKVYAVCRPWPAIANFPQNFITSSGCGGGGGWEGLMSRES